MSAMFPKAFHIGQDFSGKNPFSQVVWFEEKKKDNWTHSRQWKSPEQILSLFFWQVLKGYSRFNEQENQPRLFCKSRATVNRHGVYFLLDSKLSLTLRFLFLCDRKRAIKKLMYVAIFASEMPHSNWLYGNNLNEYQGLCGTPSCFNLSFLNTGSQSESEIRTQRTEAKLGI